MASNCCRSSVPRVQPGTAAPGPDCAHSHVSEEDEVVDLTGVVGIHRSTYAGADPHLGMRAVTTGRKHERLNDSRMYLLNDVLGVRRGAQFL